MKSPIGSGLHGLFTVGLGVGCDVNVVVSHGVQLENLEVKKTLGFIKLDGCCSH